MTTDDDGIMPEAYLRGVPPTAAAGLATRLRAAHGRYGWRAVAIAAYRLTCQWPGLRSALMRAKIRCLVPSELGSGVSFGRNVDIQLPSGRVTIGSNTRISDSCVVAVSANPPAVLAVGGHCYFAPSVHLCATRAVAIGNHVRVGEFTSIRDSMHEYRDSTTLIAEQGDRLGSIDIGDDVWIGRGCLIQGARNGIRIGRGCVIGANSVVLESIPDYAIAVGAPARVVGYRASPSEA